MSKKKIFDMGKNMKLEELDDIFEKSFPDLPDPFGLRESVENRYGVDIRTADLVVAVHDRNDIRAKGVYVIKNRRGMQGQATLGQVIDVAVDLLRVEFGVGVGFFEDAIEDEIRRAIANILYRHKVLPKKEWNKFMK